MPTEKKRNSSEYDLLAPRLEDMIAKMFKQQEENLTKIISANTKIINDKFNELNKKIEDFKVSLEFTEKELMDEITSSKQEHQMDMKTLKNKVHELEDRSRRSNICINGLTESENETWSDTSKKVEDLVKKKLGIQENICIERAHRGGKSQISN